MAEHHDEHSEYDLEPQAPATPAERFVPLWNSDANVGDDGHIVGNTPCTRCGYNVRGLRAGSPCPECNTPAGTGSRIDRDDEPLEFDDTGHISNDVICRKCGYNLRGLSQEKMCPECGSPVAWSAQGDRLRFANPAWLMKLCFGTIFLIAAGVIVVGVRLVSVPFSSVASDLVMHSAGLAGSVLFAFGTWLVTTKDPSHEEQQQLNARNVARFGAIALLLVNGGLMAMLIAQGTSGLSVMMYVFTILTWLATIVALFLRGQQLARRIPDRTLIASTWWALWGVGFAYVMPLLQMIVFFVGGWANVNSANVSILGMLGCVHYLLLIIFGTWSMILMFQYLTAFQEAHKSAKIIWMSAAPLK